MFYAKYKLILVLFALIGILLILIPTSRYGAGISSDSVGYISAARNVMQGGGVVIYDGSPLVVQPPLYPLLLALFGSLFKLDPVVVADILNAVLFGGIVYLGGLLTFKLMTDIRVLAVIGSLAIMVSPSLFGISVMAWSEPLFIFFVVLSLLFANSYVEKNDNVSLLCLSISVALSALTRYIGVVQIFWGAILILVFNRKSIKNKIVHFLLFILVSFLPIEIWAMRNYSISQTFFGDRSWSAHTFFQNLEYAYYGLVSWYVPDAILEQDLTIIILVVVSALIVLFSPKETWLSIKGRRHQIGPISLFLIIYLVFLVISSTTTAYESIDDRLLSPVFVPLTLLMLIFIQALLGSYRKLIPNEKIYTSIIILVFLFFLLFPITKAIIKIITITPNGQGYSGRLWMESSTIQHIKNNPTLILECTIYSNAPDAVYLITRHVTRWIPKKSHYNSNEFTYDLSSLKTTWPPEPNACLIWFDKMDRPYLFTVEELMQVTDIVPIARFADGTLYTVGAKHPPK